MRRVYVRIVCVVLTTVAWFGASAQEPVDEVPFYDPFEDDFREIIVDTTLFYSPLGDGVSIFGSMARYGLGFVSYSPRGFDERFQRAYLAGLELSGGIGRYPDYNMYTALGALSPQESRTYGAYLSGAYSPLSTDVYDMRASYAPQGISATYTFSQRRYRNGMRFRTAGNAGRGWAYSLAARGRWGEDSFVEGVFTDAFMASAAVEKMFDNGASLSFFAMAAPQQRGQKGWVEQEACDLTGNNWYNPYWGPFEGRVRNTRVRYDTALLAAACFGMYDAAGNYYSVTAGYRGGSRGRSGLAWFDAPNPMPDYYANMPGHNAEPNMVEGLTDAWLNGGTAVSQYDWEEMYTANLLSDDGAALYVADRHMEAPDNFQLSFNVAGAERDGFGFDYGVRLRSDNSSFYREVYDLLGAEYAVNRDPFTGADSNVRDAGRLVGEGERYDYDYHIRQHSVSAYCAGHYRHGQLGVSFGAEVAGLWLLREGHYEKETLQGKASYGPSETCAFTPYNVFLACRYGFTARHRISLELYTGEYAPDYEDVFLSPDYSNAVFAGSRTETIWGAGLDYRLPLSHFAEFQLSGYAMRTSDGTRISHYYDDVYGKYCDLVLSGIGTVDWGVEAGARIHLTERLELLAAVSVGGNTYCGDPRVDIFEDASGEVLMSDSRTRLDGYVHTTSPQTAVTAALNYTTRSRWSFTAEWMYAGRRYVTVNPLRRTERIVSLFASPEERAACVGQERLPDAWVVNIGVTKGFSLFGTYVFASLSVDNLLDRRDILYGGYEQMRLDKYTVDGKRTYSPFPSRYSYAYPRTLLVSLTVSF